VATLVNSLQNRVKSITLCVILNAKKMGNSRCDAMHSDWMAVLHCFLVWNCNTKLWRKWRWLHPWHGGTCPHFYKWLGTGAPRVRRTKKTRKWSNCTGHRHTEAQRLPKRLILLVKPKKWRARQKIFWRFAPDMCLPLLNSFQRCWIGLHRLHRHHHRLVHKTV